MRRRLAVSGLATMVLVALLLAPTTSVAAGNTGKFNGAIRLGKYKGKLGGVGELSFTVKHRNSPDLEDFIIRLFGEPTCDSPPASWPYPLPQSADFRVVTEVSVIRGGKLYPEVPRVEPFLELSYGFYPFPPVEESQSINGRVSQFLGRFTTKSKVKGQSLILFSDDFLPAQYSAGCRYSVFGTEWSAKHR